MPELPEVEVIRRSLEKKIKQKKVKKVIVRNRNLRFKIARNFENIFKNHALSKSAKNFTALAEALAKVSSE